MHSPYILLATILLHSSNKPIHFQRLNDEISKGLEKLVLQWSSSENARHLATFLLPEHIHGVDHIRTLADHTNDLFDSLHSLNETSPATTELLATLMTEGILAASEELLSNEINEIFDDYLHDITEPCKNSLTSLTTSLVTLNFTPDQAALSLIDATGNVFDGNMLEESILHVGDFDSCISAQNIGYSGQYCTLSTDKLIEPELLLPMKRIIGICLPSTCTLEDIRTMFDQLEVNISNETETVTVDDQVCRTRETENLVFDSYIKCILCFLTAYTLLHIFCSLYDYVEGLKGRRELLHPLIGAFSISRNFDDFWLSAREDREVPVVDGMVTAATFLVVLRHTYVAFALTPLANVQTYMNYLPTLLFFLQNVLSPTEVIIFVSGLVTTLKIIQSEGRGCYSPTRKIFQNYFRKTLTLGFLLVIFMPLFPLFATGSRADDITRAVTTRCFGKSWRFLTYSYSLFDDFNECQINLWTICVEMQLFIITQLLAKSVLRHPRTGFIGTGLIFLMSLILSVGNTIINEYPVRISGLETAYFSDIAKWWFLIPPWIVGITTGILVTNALTSKKKPLHQNDIISGWTIIFVLLAVYVSLGMKIQQGNVSSSQAASFVLVSRVFVPILCGWIVYTFIRGNEGALGRILSIRCTRTLSRLAFAIHVIHFSFQLIKTSVYKAPVFFDVHYFIYVGIMDFLASVVLAFFLHVLVEMPFHKVITYFSKEPCSNAEEQTESENNFKEN